MCSGRQGMIMRWKNYLDILSFSARLWGQHFLSKQFLLWVLFRKNWNHKYVWGLLWFQNYHLTIKLKVFSIVLLFTWSSCIHLYRWNSYLYIIYRGLTSVVKWYHHIWPHSSPTMSSMGNEKILNQEMALLHLGLHT